MRGQVATVVKGRLLPLSCIRVLSIVAIATLNPFWAVAQDEGPREVELPNPMTIHTWFIIAAVGAFLAWCISYILDKQKETPSGKVRRASLLQQKNQLLDRIADLESQKDSGKIPQTRYEKEYRKARGRLSEVLSRLKADTAEE